MAKVGQPLEAQMVMPTNQWLVHFCTDSREGSLISTANGQLERKLVVADDQASSKCHGTDWLEGQKEAGVLVHSNGFGTGWTHRRTVL